MYAHNTHTTHTGELPAPTASSLLLLSPLHTHSPPLSPFQLTCLLEVIACGSRAWGGLCLLPFHLYGADTCTPISTQASHSANDAAHQRTAHTATHAQHHTANTTAANAHHTPNAAINAQQHTTHTAANAQQHTAHVATHAQQHTANAAAVLKSLSLTAVIGQSEHAVASRLWRVHLAALHLGAGGSQQHRHSPITPHHNLTTAHHTDNTPTHFSHPPNLTDNTTLDPESSIDPEHPLTSLLHTAHSLSSILIATRASSHTTNRDTTDFSHSHSSGVTDTPSGPPLSKSAVSAHSFSTHTANTHTTPPPSITKPSAVSSSASHSCAWEGLHVQGPVLSALHSCLCAVLVLCDRDKGGERGSALQ